MSRNKWSSFSIMMLLMLFLAGLFLVLYPSIQGAVVDRRMGWEADSFLARLEDDPDKDIPTVIIPSTELEKSRPYPELWDSMAVYNQQIYTDGQSTFSEAGAYQATLFSLTDYGLPDETFGVISISKLNLEMPCIWGLPTKIWRRGPLSSPAPAFLLAAATPTLSLQATGAGAARPISDT